jgi:flap endonuclease-1
MGIKHLNSFLRNNCKGGSIRKIQLSELSGKTVVIDTSIYLYKFIGADALMENMYLFISLLTTNNIIPIFVFDGKPPPEKRDLLMRRYYLKKDAEKKYIHLQNKLEEQRDKVHPNNNNDILLELEKLKKQFIRIRDEDINNSKRLLDAFGIVYYDAQGEADQLCAYLLKTNRAWGCLSDDMDMFLYGCPFIIRHLSLMNKTVVLYDRDAIIKDLQMSERHFCETLVLSGTDYNLNTNISLTESMRWFKEYNNYRDSCNKLGLKILEFYVWLFKNKKIIDYLKLLKTYQMFHLFNDDDFEAIVNKNQEKEKNSRKIKEIMSGEGFIFT